MGFWDDLLKKGRDKAAEEAGKAAARQTVGLVKKTVEGLAEDFLGFAERELEEAQAAREGRGEGLTSTEVDEALPEVDAPTDEASDEVPARDQPTAEQLAAEREARARAELEELKSALRAGNAEDAVDPAEVEPPIPEDDLASRPPAVRARIERERRAQEELEALKRQLLGGDGPPPKKTL